MKRERVYRYYARLRLLYAGLVFESIELESIDFLGGQQNDMGIDIIKRIGRIAWVLMRWCGLTHFFFHCRQLCPESLFKAQTRSQKTSRSNQSHAVQ